jgi:trimeric autotransporter adhesin
MASGSALRIEGSGILATSSTLSSSGNITLYITANSTTFKIAASGASFTGTIDNISVKLADADRSVNNKGLIVNGTITRTAVATGADLVAYSGFSASNYLEQPYNSALDFGTGDFCVMGWIKTTDATASLVMRSGVVAVDSYRLDFISGLPRFRVRDAANDKNASGTSVINNGTWRCIAGVRSSETLYLYVDGVLAATTTGSTADASFDSTLRIGLYHDGSFALTNGSLALLRISATAPTASQIAKIYNDEKVLFQDGAQATLAGTSDAVTSLAYDDVTQELLVGTSQNTSVFRGLRRVETISGSASVISSSNGLRVIGG